MNLTSLDSLGSWELIYVYLKPKHPRKTLIKSLEKQPEHILRSILVTHERA